MAWTEYYIDPVDGSDADAGTYAAPWQTLDYAFQNMDSNQIPRRLNISNKGVNTISSPLVTSHTINNTPAGMIEMIAWDNAVSGGFTLDTTDGRTIPAYEIDGNAQGQLFTTSTGGRNRYITMRGAIVKNISLYVVASVQGQIFEDCEFHDTSASYQYVISSAGQAVEITRCKFIDQAGGALNGPTKPTRYCLFDNCQSNPSATAYCVAGRPGNVFEYNVFRNCGVAGSSTRSAVYTNNQDGVTIENNVFHITDSTQQYAINIAGGSCSTIVRGNIFIGYDHVSSAAIYRSATGPNGSHMTFFGHNAFYNVSNTYAGVSPVEASNFYISTSAENITLASDPFTDSTDGDYTIASDSSVYGVIPNQFISLSATVDSDNFLKNIGAFQEFSSTSSGGSSTSVQVATMHID